MDTTAMLATSSIVDDIRGCAERLQLTCKAAIGREAHQLRKRRDSRSDGRVQYLHGSLSVTRISGNLNYNSLLALPSILDRDVSGHSSLHKKREYVWR